MILRSLRYFFSGTPEDYLKTEMSKNLDDIRRVLSNLGLGDNFNGFITTVEIPASSEVSIANNLNPRMPRYRIILRSNVAEIIDGTTEWTNESLYLKNNNAVTAASVTIAFLP